MAALQQLAGLSPCCSTTHQAPHKARPFTAQQRPAARRHRHRLIARAEDGDNQTAPAKAKSGITEDVLERLRKAEAEAASLRAQLKASKPVTVEVGCAIHRILINASVCPQARKPTIISIRRCDDIWKDFTLFSSFYSISEVRDGVPSLIAIRSFRQPLYYFFRELHDLIRFLPNVWSLPDHFSHRGYHGLRCAEYTVDGKHLNNLIMYARIHLNDLDAQHGCFCSAKQRMWISGTWFEVGWGIAARH